MIQIWVDEEDRAILNERYDLAAGRVREILQEQLVPADFVSYFHRTAQFVLLCDEVKSRLETGAYDKDPALRRADNLALYEDILPENYDRSFANPAYACSVLGEEMGRLLCFLYAQLRGLIAYVFEGKLEETVSHVELFVQIYGMIASMDSGLGPKEAEAVKDVLYWFESDYADVIAAHRIREQIDPDCSFFTDILMHADLSDTGYLYRYGEYITENEIRMARFLSSLPQKEIDRMADTWTEGYRMGFVLGRKPLEKKRTVNLHYFAGFERVVRKAVENFERMGLRPTVFRYSVSALTTQTAVRSGFSGAVANPQYDYDHKEDAALMLDARFAERKAEVIRTTFEERKDLANAHGGPAVLELFGRKPFEPERCPYAWTYDEAQCALNVKLRNRLSRITQEYIIGKERSYTIISFPTPEIDPSRFEEIFRETIRVNTLSCSRYTKIQEIIIDALNKGHSAHIVGAGKNRTELVVRFVSDDTLARFGFSLGYTTISTQYCHGVVSSNTNSGNITDGSDEDDYVAFSDCHFRVIVAGSPYTMLHINYLDLEEDRDFLYVFDELPRNDRLLMALTGEMSDTTIFVNKRKLYFIFTSDEANNRAGFDIDYYGTTGVEELEMDGFRAYPNPVSDELNIRTASPMKVAVLRDMAGRELRRVVVDDNSFTLPVSSLADGVYLLQIQMDNKLIVKKIVVSK